MMPSSLPSSLRDKNYHTEEMGKQEERGETWKRQRAIPEREPRRKRELTRKIQIMHVSKVRGSTDAI